MNDLSPYHAQITAVDLLHIGLIMVLYLVQFWLVVKSHADKDAWYLLWVPVFAIGMFGLLARNDTMVKRLGGWLANMGDLWEQALAGHAPTKYLMPGADILVFIPALVMIWYAEVQIWQYWAEAGNYKAQGWYFTGTLAGVLVGIGWWVLAAVKAKTGF